MSGRTSEFFESAHESFRARSSAGTTGRRFAIADSEVQITIAGKELDPVLTRALMHLADRPEGDVDLGIEAWDTPEAMMIPPAWNENEYGPRGEICGFNDSRFHTAFDHGTAALNMIDLQTRRAIFWTRDATLLPVYESAAPLRSIFSWWLQARGFLLVHAAAISRDGSGILLAGAGGSGKSTTAMTCLSAGWNYLADDYCALHVSDSPRVLSLYSSVKIDEKWLQSTPQFRDLAALPSTIHENKRIIFLHEHRPEHLGRQVADCRLVLLPRVVNESITTSHNATPAEALRALAPSSMFQTAAEGASMFQWIAEFVRRVPARWLNLGRDIETIPDVIARCLDKLQ